MKNFTLKLLLLATLFICFNLKTNAQSNTNYDILLKTETIRLADDFDNSNYSPAVNADEIVEGKYFRLIQFYEIPNDDLQQRIKDLGIELLVYIPNKAYYASLPANLDYDQIQTLPIRSFSKIENKWKESEAVQLKHFEGWAQTSRAVELDIFHFKNITKDFSQRTLESLGAVVQQSADFSNYLQIKIPFTSLDAISSLPFIYSVDQISDPGEPEHEEGRSIHRANMIDAEFPSGRHYNGEGVKVLVRDDGAVGPHIDFQGRLFQDLAGGGTHGDRVAGVASGAGNLDPTMRGSATGTDVYVQNYQANFMNEVVDLHQNEGVVLTNSSYGNGCNAGYNANSNIVDMMIYENPTLMHVFSTGNSGNSDCGYGAGAGWGNITGGHKIGKNVISVGSVVVNGNLVGSSSHGPSEDGRIKPDICANGLVNSTNPDNDYAIGTSGTSFASPSAMGVMAQLYQAYRELNNNETPESALLKAVMLNTAQDVENKGPDYRTGWGIVNAFRSVLLLEDERYFDDNISQGETNTHQIDIPDGTRQVRMMLYWMDREAMANAQTALIDDLDLVVTAPGGTTHLPWVLDPTPNPATLNALATNGADHLNNMEQVSIDNPVAGTYTLDVNGFGLPFGNIKYYVVYEFISDEITVTYPNGGEGLVPGEETFIHWDAFEETGNYTLEYTTDAGASWNMIANVAGDARLYEWTIPSAFSGQVKVRVSHSSNGFTDMSDENATIAVLPTNVQIDEVCFDFVKIEWDGVTNATSYEVFQLGEKYMESVGTTTDLFFSIPITDPLEEQWFAVKALGDNGLASRRTIAIGYLDGQLDCALPIDLASVEPISPTVGTNFACEAYDEVVMFEFENAGLTSLADFEVSYQFDNQAVVTETYTDSLHPDQSVVFTFATPITLTTSGSHELKVWVNDPLDPAQFNDTLSVDFNVTIDSPVGLDVMEDFESGNVPPLSWRVENPDAGTTWEAEQTIGPDGNTTTTAHINNYFYNAAGQIDELITMSLDLTGVQAPTLSFDYAYVPFSLTLFDSMKVEIYGNCGDQLSAVLFAEGSLGLATLPAPITANWEPQSADDWENIVLDLSMFMDDTITVKFVGVNGYGNNLYLDNVNIASAAVAPIAGFDISTTEVCVNKPVTFTPTTSVAGGTTFNWDFGTNAAPFTTSTDQGPHEISFSTPGTQTITMEVTNPFGTDMITQTVNVVDLPTANFTFTNTLGEYNFLNSSTGADSYLWEFGNGLGATIENPSHTYATSGTYTVSLSAISDICDTSIVFTQTIDVIITDVDDLNNNFTIDVFPNPNDGIFYVNIESEEAENFQLELFDMNGRRLNDFIIENKNNTVTEVFDVQHLSQGVYFLKVKTDNGVSIRKVVVQ